MQDTLPRIKGSQSEYENDTWKRSLDFMIEENIRLKDRLSEILTDKFDKNLLEEADSFQSRFIKQDELVGILKDDLKKLSTLIQGYNLTNENYFLQINRKRTAFREDMTTAENHFSHLKSDFNLFLSENIL